MPPKTWRPDPAWLAAPDDWKFWVDGKGNAVRGPVGRYGGPSRRVVALGAGGLVLFLAVNFWALSAIGLFDGGPSDSQAAPIVNDRSVTPSVQTTPPPKTTKTAESSAPPPVAKTTKPTTIPTPAKTRTTKKRQERETTPTKPTATKTTVKSTRPTPRRPPTREEMIARYCTAQGWDPAWCDPGNWPHPDGP